MAPIVDEFDVARLYGRAAFEELALAAKIANKKVPDLKSLDVSQLHQLFQNVDHCHSEILIPLIKSITLFQASIEVIVFEYIDGLNLKLDNNFSVNWKEIAGKFGEKEVFNRYLAFYKLYRNNIIHFGGSSSKSSKNSIMTLKNIEFCVVYEGVYAGWESFKEMSVALGRVHDQDSWAIVCSTYGLPNLGSVKKYPKMNKLKKKIWSEYEVRAKNI